jgi:hypothetical protein
VNHSDYNVFADAGWTPTMRHSWNPDNTPAQWQKRFKEDLHSALIPVAFEQKGTGFSLNTCDGLKEMAPLPAEIRTIIQPPLHGGCRRTEWPPA